MTKDNWIWHEIGAMNVLSIIFLASYSTIAFSGFFCVVRIAVFVAFCKSSSLKMSDMETDLSSFDRMKFCGQSYSEEEYGWHQVDDISEKHY